MRERTKTATVWMVMVAGERKSCWDNPQGARAARDAHNNHRPHLLHGATISKVTRYRLAPLVELPAWDRVGSEWSVAKNAEEYAARIEVDQDPDDEENACFEVFVYDEDGGTPDENVCLLESSTLDAAKEWAEARLRELGYRVARPK